MDETLPQSVFTISNDTNEFINRPITESEISTAIKRLKNYKSSGYDCILNEHIKSSISVMIPIYIIFLNIFSDYGLVPESWSMGNI